MLTLPLILAIVLIELSIGEFIVLYLLDWRSQVKRNFLVTYAVIYLFIAGLTFLFQQNFSTPTLLNTFSLLDKNWTGALTLPLLLFLLLLLPYTVFLFMDKYAGVDGREKLKKEQPAANKAQRARLISGGLAAIAGLVTLFVLGMIYHSLASSSIASVFIVGSFFAGALALGGVFTAMWLGHWYLVTPALSEKPLQFATILVLLGVLAQVVFAFTGPTIASTHPQSTPTVSATTTPAVTAATPGTTKVKPANVPTVTPLSTDAIGWLRILVSFVMPLVLLALILKLIHDRSFQSATGMLYLVVVLTLAGEAMARGLFLIGLQ